MQSLRVMLNTVKHLVESVGDNAGDFAKRFGPFALDAAKHVGDALGDAGKSVGSNATQLARRVGPKRAILGIALLGVAVGSTIFVMRYLRDRRDEEVEGEDHVQASPPSHGVRRGGSKRKANRAQPPVH